MYEMEGPRLARAALAAGKPATVRHGTPPVPCPLPGVASGVGTSSVVK
jgi:hypothetical protein